MVKNITGQVCLSLADSLTKKREMTSLARAMDELRLTEGTLVTLDEDQQIEKAKGNTGLEIFGDEQLVNAFP